MKKANQNYYCRDYLQEHIVTGQERTAPKLKKSRYRLDIKKKYSLLWGWWGWKRFPREVADTPSLEVSKVRLDRALSNLIWWDVSLPMADEIHLMAGVGTRWGPFQHKPFYDSVKYSLSMQLKATFLLNSWWDDFWGPETIVLFLWL